jgi:hypothetical protein
MAQTSDLWDAAAESNGLRAPERLNRGRPIP